MKLSFVIPAYNEENYLGKTLESITRAVTRSKEEIEIIVVNNASTDQTKKIAQKFPQVILVDELRKGLPMARQAGFERSTGDLIANVDADCLLPSDWIKKVFFEFSRNDDLVALSGPYIYYDLPWTTNLLGYIYYFFGYLIHLVNHYILKKGAMIQGGNFVLRKTALEKVGGFNTKINFYGEDTDIANRIQKVGRVYFKFSFSMYTSGRRLEKEGYLKTFFYYVANFFWVLFFKKPFTQKYTCVSNKK